MGIILNRRRICGGKSLPYDAEIEYLESSGTQFIDTEVVGEGDLKVDTTIGIKKNKTCSFGSRISFSYKAFYFSNGGTSGSTWDEAFINYNDSYYISNNFPTKDDLIIQISFSNDFYLDGNLKNHYDLASFSNNLNIYIFAANFYGTTSMMASMRLYYFKIYKGDAVIRDFIPVRVGQVGYMYDKVTKQIFGNAGTGDFILGPDKGSAVIITQQQQHEMYGE